MDQKPTLWIIAGPNGAGKSTIAEAYLPRIREDLPFLNVDQIEQGIASLSKVSAIMAGRLALKQIEEFISDNRSFALETTASSNHILRLCQRLKEKSWSLKLLYVYINSWRLSQERVSARVAKGGHDIDLKAIVRRYPRSLANLLELLYLSDEAIIIDNSNNPLLFMEKRGGCLVALKDIPQNLRKWLLHDR